MKVNFNNDVNFWQIALFSRSKNLDELLILKKAFEQNALREENKKFLERFINSLDKNIDIKSQLYQDVFASFIINDKFDKTFLEFGATDGLNLSNSYMLEKTLGWKGVLSEPSPQWHNSLKNNRRNTKIIDKCIWCETGITLDFFMSESGELSTLKDYVDSDISSLPGNTKQRKKAGKIIPVNTISLNDVIKDYFNNKPPSYISIDTEGSEYEILKSFNFKTYRPKVFTIEHNFTELQFKLDDLMTLNNYERIFRNLTAFDAWYVSKETLKELDF